MTIDFDYTHHQKVRYLGTDKSLTKNSLYVVIKDEYPNLYEMKPDETMVIHITNKFGQVIFNDRPHIREVYKVKKAELSFEGDLFTPLEWR